MTPILLADPNPDIHRALRLLLRQRLGQVSVVKVQCIDRLADEIDQARPQLLLADWSLLQGAGVLPALRQAHPGMAIIALSIHQEDQPAAQSAGVDGFIYKGAAPEEVLACVRLHI